MRPGVSDVIVGSSMGKRADPSRRGHILILLDVCVFPVFDAAEERSLERGSQIVVRVVLFCRCKIATYWCKRATDWLPCNQMARNQGGQSAWDISAMKHVGLNDEAVDELARQDVARMKGRIEIDLRALPKMLDITKYVWHLWLVCINESLQPWQ